MPLLNLELSREIGNKRREGKGHLVRIAGTVFWKFHAEARLRCVYKDIAHSDVVSL